MRRQRTEYQAKVPAEYSQCSITLFFGDKNITRPSVHMSHALANVQVELGQASA